MSRRLVGRCFTLVLLVWLIVTLTFIAVDFLIVTASFLFFLHLIDSVR